MRRIEMEARKMNTEDKTERGRMHVDNILYMIKTAEHIGLVKLHWNKQRNDFCELPDFNFKPR